MQTHDFKRLIERVKLSSPIEEIVQERVSELKRAGSLWEACCPFHEERTPSFKVDPRRGTWHCYGSCGEGGDVLQFLERFDGLSFRESLALLADRAGIELPSFGGGGGRSDADDPLYTILERAAAYYAKQLRSADGRAALEYARGRGLSDATLEAFGTGWAPARGNPVLTLARQAGLPDKQLLATGLVRKSDRGDLYDFFRGRWMIPIRTRTGRVAGFGGRSVPDSAGNEPAGPKYVNTPETPVFHKGRLIYGFDRALDFARRQRHLILVEGYTDVMAAHQVGLGQVAAVLGTSTTEDHAGLVRRSGARRVTLVFDGDAAGRKATLRALAGLLPLDIDIDVVAPPEGRDPCDLLLTDGAESFLGLLNNAQDWFDFALDGLRGLAPRELATEVDGVLELLARLSKPVDRDARLTAMARSLELPEAGIREQWNTIAARASARRAAPRTDPAAPKPSRVGRAPADSGTTASRVPGALPVASAAPVQAAAESGAGQGDAEGIRLSAALEAEADAFAAQEGAAPAEPALEAQAASEARALAAAPAPSKAELRPYSELVGAVLLDTSLMPMAREALAQAPHADLLTLGRALCELYDDVDDERPIDEARLIDALGEHPARRHVVRLAEQARGASSPLELAQGALHCLELRRKEQQIELEKRDLANTPEPEREKLQALYRRFLETRRVPSGDPATASASRNV